MALLEIRGLVVDYGVIRALKGIDLDVEEGTVVAILGANGAGKSTTIRAVNGVVKPTAGTIRYRGEDVTGHEPFRLAARGVIQSPEGRHVLRGLTVEENLLVGAYSLKRDPATGKSARTLRKEAMADVFELFPILKERLRQQASTLSGGEQQMLAIGRALMARPKLLLLDEPSLGLAPLIVKEIFATIAAIRAKGTTILIVEQNAYQTLKIADYAYLLELGRVKSEGRAADLLADDRLVKAYLGG